MVSASEVLEAFKSLSDVGDSYYYPDAVEWGELSSILEGSSKRIPDPAAKYGYRYERGPAPVFPFGSVKVVEDFGGEGQGERRYLVVEVTAHDGTKQYFRKDGYYASYDGTTWDGDFSEVKAVTRQVVFYE